MNNHVNKRNPKSINKNTRATSPRENHSKDTAEETHDKRKQPTQLPKLKAPDRDIRWIVEKRDETELRAHKLNSHTARNESISHINASIYHLLCDSFTFGNAYVKISKNRGALTKGVAQDAEVNQYFGQNTQDSIAAKFKSKSFNWEPVRRTMIEKPGKKKKRPIDTPTQENRIAQEALRGILEAIYEPEFREFEQRLNYKGRFYCTNYGFRPNKSTFQAVDNLTFLGRGATHAVEGDIVGAYNNVDHDILLAILSRRIKDRPFLTTIKQLLKSGIMHKDKFINSTVGTPQGGIVSPLLFNIYMFELDKFVYDRYVLPATQLKANWTSINNPEYKRLSYEITKSLKAYRKLEYVIEKRKARKELKALNLKRMAQPSKIPHTLPKKVVYARYADDWVLFVTGPESYAQEVKTQITQFLRETLKMELDADKTKITRIDEGFGFLGFRIKQWTYKQMIFGQVVKYKDIKSKATIRFPKRVRSRNITAYPDSDRIHTNLLRNKFCISNKLTPVARAAWTLLDEYEIVLKYNQVFQGLANYYRYCSGFRALNRVSYILQYSCAKTISYRQKSSISKVFKKYGKSLTISREIHNPKGTVRKQIYFETHAQTIKKFAQQRKEGKEPPSFAPVSYDPFRIITYWRTKFKLYTHCCICGSEDRIALHHINSLRAIKAKDQTDRYSYWRSCLNRLQIPVCHSCHLDITNGVYSDASPVELYDEFIARL